MSSNIRMLALDLDGTTLRKDKSLSDRNSYAIWRAYKKGVNVVISTGRPFTALSKPVLSLGVFQYVINSNGAMITDLYKRERIYAKYIAPDKVDEIRSVIGPAGRRVELFVNGCAYADRKIYDEIKRSGSSYRNPTYFLSTRTPVDDIFSMMDEHKYDLENISVFFEEKKQKEEVGRELAKIQGITLTSSVPSNYEMGAAGVSKASALTFLMKRLGIKSDELMAVGDSINDLDMIKLAGVGVAMGNGEDKLKENADFVTDTNEMDGVAKAIEKYILK